LDPYLEGTIPYRSDIPDLERMDVKILQLPFRQIRHAESISPEAWNSQFEGKKEHEYTSLTTHEVGGARGAKVKLNPRTIYM